MRDATEIARHNNRHRLMQRRSWSGSSFSAYCTCNTWKGGKEYRVVTSAERDWRRDHVKSVSGEGGEEG